MIDPIVPACDHAIGDLAVGESTTYECTVESVTERTRNVATATGETPDGEVVRDDDEAVVTPTEDEQPPTEEPPPGEAPECPDPSNPDCPDLPDTGGLPLWLLLLGGGLVCVAGLVFLVARLQHQDD